MILTLAVSGYRSLRNLVIPLENLTVVTGANGTGKSSLYRAIRLLADVAQGRAIGALAREGGLQSTLWAGPESFSKAMKSGEVPVQGTVRKGRISLKLGFASEDYGYAIDLGLPVALGRRVACSTSILRSRPKRSGSAKVLKRRGDDLRQPQRAGGVQVLDDSGKARARSVMTDLSQLRQHDDPRRRSARRARSCSPCVSACAVGASMTTLRTDQ